MRPRRRLTDEQRRTLTITAGNLAALKTHPSWPDLETAIRIKEEKLRRYATTLALSPEKAVDQRDLDEIRGFINGMTYMLAVVENAETRLEGYLKAYAAEGG